MLNKSKSPQRILKCINNPKERRQFLSSLDDSILLQMIWKKVFDSGQSILLMMSINDSFINCIIPFILIWMIII